LFVKKLFEPLLELLKSTDSREKMPTAIATEIKKENFLKVSGDT
jgi:hypothetical protein